MTKNNLMSKFLFIINAIIFSSLIYFSALLYGKYALVNNNFKTSEKIFKMTKVKKGYFLSLLGNNKIEDVEHILKKSQNPEYEGIYFWANSEYENAAIKFAESGNKQFEAYSHFKNGEYKKAEQLNQNLDDEKLNAYFHTIKNELSKSVSIFLKLNDNLGLFKIFLKTKNFPTAIYYLLMNNKKSTTAIADLIKCKELPPQTDELIDGKLNDFEIWASFLRGSPEIFNKPEHYLPKDRDLNAVISFLKGDFQSLFLLNPPFLDLLLKQQDINRKKEKEFEGQKITKELQSKFEKIRIYSIVPDKVIVGKLNRKFITIFGLILALIAVFFSTSLFYLFRKYKINQNVQRQKDLEKMDALSIAKSERMAAKRKRDKTELNVSSFVTLNIQMEVLDLAFTKLGIRVNPKKLAEQLEKTNIPNISYKIYTISNSYHLAVKMLSTTAPELKNAKQEGVIIIVLKGDLVALLKNADDQNAYLQFSQKDSRKVPFSALKLSWEGNYILLNRT